MMRRIAAAVLPESVKAFVRRRAVDPLAERFRSYRGVALRYAPGARMDLVRGDGISDAIARNGVWEPDVTRELLALAAGGGTFVQVGANLGYFPLLWAAARPDNTAYAFEPVERNVGLLRRNVRQSGLVDRVHVLPVAAGGKTEIAWFDDGPTEQTGWGGLAGASTQYGSRTSVVVVRLDDLFPDRVIDVLMVDTEGADTWVLAGAERLLREKRVRALYYEQNKPRMRLLGIPEGESERFLERVGYRPVRMSDPAADVAEWRAAPAG